MLLLFLSLLTGVIKDKWVRQAATFLTDNMMIFFMPAFMGIMDLWGVVKMNFWAWMSVLVFSTLLVLMATGLVETVMERFNDRKNGGGPMLASAPTQIRHFPSCNFLWGGV